jgi:hypothetical protein
MDTGYIDRHTNKHRVIGTGPHKPFRAYVLLRCLAIPSRRSSQRETLQVDVLKVRLVLREYVLPSAAPRAHGLCSLASAAPFQELRDVKLGLAGARKGE